MKKSGKRCGHLMGLLFIFLSGFDWFFSMIAFRIGVQEGNPFLLFCQQYSLFTPVKFMLTFLVAGAFVGMYDIRVIRRVSYVAVLMMSFVNAYHVHGLNYWLYTN